MWLPFNMVQSVRLYLLFQTMYILLLFYFSAILNDNFRLGQVPQVYDTSRLQSHRGQNQKKILLFIFFLKNNGWGCFSSRQVFNTPSKTSLNTGLYNTFLKSIIRVRLAQKHFHIFIMIERCLVFPFYLCTCKKNCNSQFSF